MGSQGQSRIKNTMSEGALPEEISFTKATPSDLQAVRALLRRCELPIEDLTPKHLEHFVLCHVRDRVVGSVGLEVVPGEAALLRSLAVAPEERARGVGRELWACAREQAGTLAVRRLYLLTTTAESLFRKWGFGGYPGTRFPRRSERRWSSARSARQRRSSWCSTSSSQSGRALKVTRRGTGAPKASTVTSTTNASPVVSLENVSPLPSDRVRWYGAAVRASLQRRYSTQVIGPEICHLASAPSGVRCSAVPEPSRDPPGGSVQAEVVE
jgi:amino-acid N-acetyltransferase